MNLLWMIAGLLAISLWASWLGVNTPVQAGQTDQVLPWWSASYQLYPHPHAIWLTRDQQVGDNLGPLLQVLQAAKLQKRRPELVLYYIPERDLGESSEGGFATFGHYLQENALLAGAMAHFVKETGIRPRVFLEPDALAQAISFRRARQDDTRSVTTYRQRTRALNDAAQRFKQAGALVYLDAAHSKWMSQPADVQAMAEALIQSGVAQVDGIATNTSNRQPVDNPHLRDEWDYIRELLPLLPSRKKQPYDVVIDTSRNGGMHFAARQYFLARNGDLIDNQLPTGRLIGRWRQDDQGNLWFHPFFGPPKALTRLLKKEKYQYLAEKRLLIAPEWLDPLGDVQLGAEPTNQVALSNTVRFRHIKPPDDCDGSLGCPPGQSKHHLLQDTARLQPTTQLVSPAVWWTPPSSNEP